MTSGFGKVILLGEHAVVYGYPALAGAVSLRVAARVQPADESSLAVPAWSLAARASDDGPVGRAVTELVRASCPATEEWKIVATSTLPARAGLGSSAALSVAITRALATAHGEHVTDAEVEARASCGERCFHETPSGVDVAVAARGGFGLFTRGNGFEPIAAEPIRVVVGLTGEPRSTKDMVAVVSSARQANREGVEKILARLGALAELGAASCQGDERELRDQKLGTLFGEAQTLLAELGVSSAGIDEMVEAAGESGALGAKLTGAGGGGAVIAISPDREEDLASSWRALGKEAFVTEVGIEASSAQ